MNHIKSYVMCICCYSYLSKASALGVGDDHEAGLVDGELLEVDWLVEGDEEAALDLRALEGVLLLQVGQVLLERLVVGGLAVERVVHVLLVVEEVLLVEVSEVHLLAEGVVLVEEVGEELVELDLVAVAGEHVGHAHAAHAGGEGVVGGVVQAFVLDRGEEVVVDDHVVVGLEELVVQEAVFVEAH